MMDHNLLLDSAEHPKTACPSATKGHELFEEHKVIERRSQVGDFYPLSPLQTVLWLRSKLTPDSDEYLIQVLFEIEGRVDPVAMKQAWLDIILRHDLLRTGFIGGDDLEMPLQFVVSDVAVPYEFIDWRDVNQAVQTIHLHELINVDRTVPFNLSEPPLLRFKFVQSDSNKSYFLWSYHQSLLDGWSISLILQDVLANYRGLTGRATPKLVTRRPYREYIGWLQIQDKDCIADFWERYLGGLSERTVLKLNSQPLLSSTLSHDTHEVSLSLEDTRQLNDFARSQHVTLNTVMQVTWGLLLSHYCQQEDVVFGVVHSGRGIDLADADKMIGMFINILPCRVGLNAHVDVGSLLQSVHDQLGKTQHHMYTSLLTLQKRYPNCAFETLVAFKNHPMDKAVQEEEGNYFRMTEIRVVEKSEYPLSVIVEPGEQLSVKFDYQLQHFYPEQIAQLMRHLLSILSQVVAAPQQFLHDIVILSEAERELQLVTWNQTATPYPGKNTIHGLFEEQVSQTPDAIAVESGDIQLSYHKLNAQANQIARHLQAHGVKLGDLVALSLERSANLLVGMLGILKAGGAYVPIDTRSPQKRLAFLLADTKAKVLLTETSLVKKFESFDCKYICLDDLSFIHTLSEYSEDNLEISSNTTSLAYVIYTSGSTGQPKGVMVEHHGVLRLVKSTNYIKFCPNGRIGQAATISFDAATFEVWGALLNGGCSVILPKDILLSPELLSTFLRDQHINVLLLTSALFNQIVKEDSSVFATLDYLLIGGEALNVLYVNKVLDSESAPKNLLNVYGPTENTTFTTIYAIDSKIPEECSVSIGTPIANTTTYILDKHQHLLPAGVIGELYTGGAGLARGYLNQQELTASRFIPHPFVSGERLYRTGDLARYLLDGRIEFLGRIDTQVKIRSYRIELGEIEYHLLTHNLVKSCVVLYKDPYLLAYLEVHNINEIDIVATFTSFLEKRLPDYMIPNRYIILDNFPLSLNGKLDRNYLLEMQFSSKDICTSKNSTQQSRIQHQQVLFPNYHVMVNEYIAPKTKIEAKLCTIWQDILTVDRVGVMDDFFSLGGNSLSAFPMIMRINKELRCNLTVADIFSQKCILNLAQTVSRKISLQSIIKPLSTIDNTLPIIYFLHTIFGGPEVYKTIVDLLSSEYQSFGLDNYHLYFENKIDHLSILAKYYIYKIESEQNLSSPIILFGWSSGGKICIEMAYQLEQKGFKNIYVYLLDTFYLHDKLNHAELLDRLKMTKGGKDPQFVEYTLNAADALLSIDNDVISGQLQYTTVTLFKALKLDDGYKTSEALEKARLQIQIKDNGIQRIVQKQIRIVKLCCSHMNILKNSAHEIFSILKNDKKMFKSRR